MLQLGSGALQKLWHFFCSAWACVGRGSSRVPCRELHGPVFMQGVGDPLLSPLQGNMDQERLKKQQELAAAAIYQQLQQQQLLQLVNRYGRCPLPWGGTGQAASPPQRQGERPLGLPQVGQGEEAEEGPSGGMWPLGPLPGYSALVLQPAIRPVCPPAEGGVRGSGPAAAAKHLPPAAAGSQAQVRPLHPPPTPSEGVPSAALSPGGLPVGPLIGAGGLPLRSCH